MRKFILITLLILPILLTAAVNVYTPISDENNYFETMCIGQFALWTISNENYIPIDSTAYPRFTIKVMAPDFMDEDIVSIIITTIIIEPQKGKLPYWINTYWTAVRNLHFGEDLTPLWNLMKNDMDGITKLLTNKN